LSELEVVTETTQLLLENTGTTLQVESAQIRLVAVAEQGPAGPPGPPGGGGLDDYVHTQASAAATWAINHNLGRKPDITLLSVGDQEIEGTITHTSINQAVASFNVAVAGSARCI
jgi:hypothetical protein